MDCFLLASGERNLKPKWHLRRLAKAGETGILSQYLQVLGLDRASAEDAKRVIGQTERLLCSVLQIPSLDRYKHSPLFHPRNNGS